MSALVFQCSWRQSQYFTIYPGPHTYTNDEDIPEEFRFIIQDSLDTKSDSYDTSSIATTDSTNQIEVTYDSSDDSEDSDDQTSFEADTNQVRFQLKSGI